MMIIYLKVPCRCWEGERMVELKELDNEYDAEILLENDGQLKMI